MKKVSANEPRLKWRWEYLMPLLIVCVIGIFALRAEFHDRFRRIEFDLGNKLNGVAILQKQKSSPLAIIVCAGKDAGRHHLYSRELHVLAEMGYAAVAFQYKTNSFSSDFREVLHYLRKQSWVQEVPGIWIDFRGEDSELFEIAIKQEVQPAMIARFDRGWNEMLKSAIAHVFPNELLGLKSHLMIIESSVDEPLSTQQSALQLANEIGASIQYCRSHSHSDVLTEDRSVAVRIIGEYGKRLLDGKETPSGLFNSTKVNEWLKPGFALALAICAFYLPYRHRRNYGWFGPGFRIWWLVAAFVLFLASGLTFVHTWFQDFRTNAFTLRIARIFLVANAWKDDFEYLADDPHWHNEPIGNLIIHSELSNYTCFRLVNWTVEKEIYQNFVLSPLIPGSELPTLGWRKLLWKHFYPRVKSEYSTAAAALIVVRHLRERLSIQNVLPAETLEVAWERGAANEQTFRRLYVASLRSVAIPARLNEGDWVEIWENGNWIEAPRPLMLDCL